MPILNVKVSGAKSPELTAQISELLLDLTTRILKKKREVTAITIDYIDPDNWIVGGKSLREQQKNSFYFDIKITDETNTKDEKALYIKEAFNGFSRILGNLHEESYIYVQDVRAASYGFGGYTQEYRYHHPAPAEFNDNTGSQK
nr:4-oxalocrotonate tautomerase family protein [Pseudomonas sp.]